MGEPVPGEWPEFDNEKWYWVTADIYKLDPITLTCHELWMRIDCCRTGQYINDWPGGGCPEVKPMCLYAGLGSSRFICANGPYDSGPECEAARGA